MRLLGPRLVRALFTLAALGTVAATWREWGGLGAAPVSVLPAGQPGSTFSANSQLPPLLHAQPGAAPADPASAQRPAPAAEIDTPPSQCEHLTGWERVVQLYAGHWDAASIVSAGTAPNTTVTRVQSASLCGRPLVLNNFGVPLVTAGVHCEDGWVSSVTGACWQGAAADEVRAAHMAHSETPTHA